MAIKIIYQPNILAQDKIICGLSDDVVCFCTCYEEIVFFLLFSIYVKKSLGIYNNENNENCENAIIESSGSWIKKFTESAPS